MSTVVVTSCDVVEVELSGVKIRPLTGGSAVRSSLLSFTVDSTGGL